MQPVQHSRCGHHHVVWNTQQDVLLLQNIIVVSKQWSSANKWQVHLLTVFSFSHRSITCSAGLHSLHCRISLYCFTLLQCIKENIAVSIIENVWSNNTKFALCEASSKHGRLYAMAILFWHSVTLVSMAKHIKLLYCVLSHHSTFLTRDILAKTWQDHLDRWARTSKSKKGKKNRHQGWQLHLYGDTPLLNVQEQIWHKGSRGRCNHLFQILSKSVKGFPSCEAPKWGFPIDFAACDWSYETALTLRSIGICNTEWWHLNWHSTQKKRYS